MTDDRTWVPPVPEIGLPPAGFAEAWHQGRSRRRRRLLTSGGTSAALGVALLVGLGALPGPTSGDSLQQVGPASTAEPRPEALPVQDPTLPPQVGPSSLPKLPALPVLPRTSPGASPQGQPSPEAEGGQQADGEQERTSAYAGSPSRPVERDYESSTPMADANGTRGGSQTVCGIDAGNRPSGQHARWCGGHETTDVRGDLAIEHRQCRAHDSEQEALTFGTTQEVEYEVRTTSGTLIWRWSDGARISPSAHELPAERGACYSWTTRWTPLSATGDPLPPGDYLLRSWVTAQELGSDVTYESTLTIAPPADED